MKYLKRFKTEEEFLEWKSSKIIIEEETIGEVQYFYNGDEDVTSVEPITIISDIYLPTLVYDEDNYADSQFEYVIYFPEIDEEFRIPIINGIKDAFEVKDGFIKIPKWMFLDKVCKIYALSNITKLPE